MTDTEPHAETWEQLRQRLAALREAMVAPANRDRDLAARLARRAETLRSQSRGAGLEGPRRNLLTFTLAAQRFAVPLENVIEVLPLEHFSPVPGAPQFVRGVVPCHGAILCLLDLGRLFEVEEAGLSDVHHVIVIEAAGARLALAATVAEEIVSPLADAIQPAPEFAVDILAESSEGVLDGNRLVLRLTSLVGHHRLLAWRSAAIAPAGETPSDH